MREAEKGNGDLKREQRRAVDTENQRRKLARRQEVVIQKARRLIFYFFLLKTPFKVFFLCNKNYYKLFKLGYDVLFFREYLDTMGL